MSRHNTVRGFSVSQPAIGAPLQFVPAMGTQELDDLIHAYIPGQGSIQEKRAIISVDFFEYSQMTGATMRYYSFDAVSSAGSSPQQDSGYGSSFVSPAISDWSWPTQSTPASATASTPSSSFIQESRSTQASSIKVASSSRSSPHSSSDFSNIPGMKIMTRDGRDVTNSASRGCKTKEQRDHAHLMRIIKACDACRRKKIRCDPSHKKRTSASSSTTQPQVLPQTQSRSRSAKAVAVATRKAKQPASPTPPAPPPQEFVSASSSSFDFDTSFDGMSMEMSGLVSSCQDPWDAFVQYDDEPYNADLPDSDFFFDLEGYITPESNLSVSPVQSVATSVQPAMVTTSSGDPHASSYYDGSQIGAADLQAPNLPYMNSNASGSTNYVDFNLFSPATSFVDEDSMPINDIGANLGGEYEYGAMAAGLDVLGAFVEGGESRGTSSASLQHCASNRVGARRNARSRGGPDRPSDSQYPEARTSASAHGQDWNESPSYGGGVPSTMNAVNLVTAVQNAAPLVDGFLRSSPALIQSSPDQRHVTTTSTPGKSTSSDHQCNVTMTSAPGQSTSSGGRNIIAMGESSSSGRLTANGAEAGLSSTTSTTTAGSGTLTPARIRSERRAEASSQPVAVSASSSSSSSPVDRPAIEVRDAYLDPSSSNGSFTQAQASRVAFSVSRGVLQRIRSPRLATRGTPLLPCSANSKNSLLSTVVKSKIHSSSVDKALSQGTLSSVLPGCVLPYVSHSPLYAITAVVALGVVASSMRLSLSLSLSLPLVANTIVHLALGFLVLGSMFRPSAGFPGAVEQRIYGTAPIPKDQTYQSDKQASVVSPSRRIGDWRSKAQGLCRQMEKARCEAVVGRLATSRLLALTR